VGGEGVNMPIADRSLGWKYKRLWIPIQGFAGLDDNGTNTISLSQGTPTLEPASGTLEIATIPMTTADEVHHVMPIPWDLDRAQPVCGRVFFIHASTDASDAPVFKVTALFYAKQAQTVEAQGGADKSVSITHPGTVATDDSLEVTNWTELGWEDYITDTDIMVAITLELDALGSATADECEIIGLELGYQIKAMQPHRAQSEYMVDENPV
jgi:hypothetical protein